MSHTAAVGGAGAAASSSESRRVTPALYQEYMAKVHYLQNHMNKRKVAKKVVSGFDKIGKFYFAEHPSGYISSSDDFEVDEDEGIPMHTKAEFKEKYLDEMGGEEEEYEALENKATFSDAFRHSVLVNVKTLGVFPLFEAGFLKELPKEWGDVPRVPSSDHVLTWDIVQELPRLLAGSDFVVLHGDTEDMLAFFFPVPNVPRERKSSTRKNSGSNRKSSSRSTRKNGASNRSYRKF
jgi:hypothetical protein